MRSNSYAKPAGDICLRCGKPCYQSNVCPVRRQAALIDDEMVEDEEVDDECARVDSAVEASPKKVNLILQKLCWLQKKKGNVTTFCIPYVPSMRRCAM